MSERQASKWRHANIDAERDGGMVWRTVLIQFGDDRRCQCLRATDPFNGAQLVRCMVHLTAVELFATILAEQGVPFHEEFLQSSRGGRSSMCRINRCAN